MEERFYAAGKFAQNFFVPNPAQLAQLLNECPFKEPRKCQEMVGKCLNLSILAEIRYKLEKNQFKARVTLHQIGDTSRSKVIYTSAPESSPLNFISRTLTTVYKHVAKPGQLLLKELNTFPTKNIKAYGCYALGYRFIIRGRFNEAFYPLSRAKEIDPDFLHPLEVLSRSYFLTGKNESAYRLIQKIPIRKSTWSQELLRAEVLLRIGKTDEAFKSLKRAEKLLPKRTAELEFAFGNYYKHILASTRGISHIIAAINLNPSVLDYYLALGELYSQIREYEAAIPYFKKLVELAPANKYYKMLYGMALRDNNQLDLAVELFKEILLSHPDYFPARIALGITYYHLGWYQKAEKTFLANIELRQDTLNSYMNLALLKIRSGNASEGEMLFKKVMLLNPESYNTLVNLAMIEIQNGKYESAENHLNRAMELGRTDTTILLALASISRGRKQEAKEFELLNKVLEIDPGNTTALTMLAEHSIKAEDYFEAINYLKEAIELHPSAYRQRLMLARCLIKINDRKMGIEQLKYVADNFTYSPEIQLLLAESYFNNRLFSEAVQTVEPLVIHKSIEFESRLLLGKTFTEQIIQGFTRRINAEKLAFENLAKALEIKPEEWKAHYWMGRYLRKIKMDYKSARMHLEKSLDLASHKEDRELIEKELVNLPL
jgi:tetratricopeptide (TPR) repeat protein